MEQQFTAAVITVSDKASRGEREDKSGPALCRLLSGNGWNVIFTAIVPDDIEAIKALLLKCCDDLKADLVLTAGGTGFSRRDVTPEATLAVVEREARGIPEAMRYASLQITPKGCLSRSAAGLRGTSLIVNVPGSPKASVENISAVLDPIKHGVQMLHTFGSADCAND